MTCQYCDMLTAYCKMGNPNLKGRVICNACIEENGIVPVKLEFDPYKYRKDLRQSLVRFVKNFIDRIEKIQVKMNKKNSELEDFCLQTFKSCLHHMEKQLENGEKFLSRDDWSFLHDLSDTLHEYLRDKYLDEE